MADTWDEELAVQLETGARGELIVPGIDVKAVVRKYTGKVGWPTVVLAFVLTAAYASVFVLWHYQYLPLVAGMAINSVVAYLFYTIHHDANHKAISGRKKKWAWLDTALGTWSAIPLQLSFAAWSMDHLRHHAYTNDKKRDPDMLWSGTLAQIPVKWVFANLLLLLAAMPGGRKMAKAVMRAMNPQAGRTSQSKPNPRILKEEAIMRRYTQLCLLALAVSIPLGLFWPTMFLWLIPGRIGMLILVTILVWFPHYPYETTEQFGASRIAPFPGSTPIMMEHDYHLIHHLYPSVPWYRYKSVYKEIRPFLVANGAYMEGSSVTPRKKIRLLNA